MEDTTIITPTSEVVPTQTESTNVEVTEEVETTEEVNTDEALQAELTKLQENKKPQRSEEEKAAYSIQKIYERFPHLKDESSGIAEVIDNDEKPLTRKEMMEILESRNQVSAMDLANSITNPLDRDMVKYHIEHTIRPSGDANADLAMAKNLVTSKRNELALAEQARRGVAKTAPSGSSAPAKEAPVETLTTEEQRFLQMGLTKEDILRARTGASYFSK